MNRLALASLIALASCGTDNDANLDQEARIAFFTVYGEMATLEAEAVSGQPVAPTIETVDYQHPCSSGSATLQGTYDGDGSTNATFTLDATFNACATGSAKLDGAMHWVTTQNATTFTQALTGTIAYEGPTYAGSFGFDLQITVDTSDPNAPSGTVTGGYMIGGRTYEIDVDQWSMLFGM